MSEVLNIHSSSKLTKPVVGKNGRRGSFFSPVSHPGYFNTSSILGTKGFPNEHLQPDQIDKDVDFVQRKCDHCEAEERVQSKTKSGSVQGMNAPSSVQEVIHNQGQSLETNTKDFMESRFGYDFSNVKVHTDSKANKSSAEINALAYTHGNHVVFGKGQYQPESYSGKRLLAHELTHVIQQQKQNNITGTGQSAGQGSVQRVQVMGGVPDFLDCELKEVRADPNTSCCSSDTLKLLPGLYAEAKKNTDLAIQRIDRGANIDEEIVRHFGKAALWYRSNILENLKTIRNELNQEKSHKPVCRIALTENTAGIDLYGKVDSSLFCHVETAGSASQGKDKFFTLCIDTDGNILKGWKLILHEVAHFSKVAILPNREPGLGNSATQKQLDTGEYEMYVHDKTYPNPMPYSLRNADSYAEFVGDISGEKWSGNSNAAAYAPTLEVGAAATLDKSPRFGLQGHLLWTPLGKGLQLTTGLTGVWFPGADKTSTGETSERPGLRAYAGAELGFRWILGGDKVQLVLDVAGGGGAYVKVDKTIDPALAARISLGVRFGDPQYGVGISVEAMKMFNLSETDLTETKTKDWIGGLMIQGHWGGSSARPR